MLFTEVPAATLVRDVNVFDGVGLIPNTSVLIEQGVIADIQQRIVPPADSVIVDGRGRTLLPGLIGCHTKPLPNRQSGFRCGVTTELDISCPLRTVEKSIPEAQSHRSRRTSQWPVDDDTPISFAADPDNDRQVGLLVSTAHARRRFIIAHISTSTEAMQALSAGVDGLAQIFVDVPADSTFIETAVRAGVFVIPTLTFFDSLGIPHTRRPIDAVRADELTTREVAFSSVRDLHLAGVPLLAGIGIGATAGPFADAFLGAGRFGLHREVELLSYAGLGAHKALAAATSTAADCLGLSDRGRIARGLHADLLLVDGDPTTDIRCIRAVAGVWYRGVPVDRGAEWGQELERGNALV